MKKSIANHVASAMEDILNSDEHKTLFDKSYKVSQASTQSGAPTTPPGNAPKPSQPATPGAQVKIDPEWGAKPVTGPSVDANKADDKCDADDCLEAHDHDMKSEASLSVAIDSLLTASAALDAAGDRFSKIATATLAFASKLVEAKKAPAKDKKDAKDKEKGKSKEKEESKKEEKPKAKKDLKFLKDLKKDDGKSSKKDMKKEDKKDADAASKKSSK